jgi:hypothetical protein
VRFALTSAPVPIAGNVSLITDYGAWPAIITVVPVLPLVAFETWPSRRNIEKFAGNLEVDGRPSYLRERLLVQRTS